VAAGIEREVLSRLADRLSFELDVGEGEQDPKGSLPLAGVAGPMDGILSAEDELLVARLRRGLAALAAGLEVGSPSAPEGAVGAALDGAEMVIRGELVCGNAAQLPELIPGFVFLVVLPVVGHDEALALSRRTETLVERTIRSSQDALGP
jgi:hypothetical protein